MAFSNTQRRALGTGSDEDTGPAPRSPSLVQEVTSGRIMAVKCGNGWPRLGTSLHKHASAPSQVSRGLGCTTRQPPWVPGSPSLQMQAALPPASFTPEVGFSPFSRMKGSTWPEQPWMAWPGASHQHAEVPAGTVDPHPPG